MSNIEHLFENAISALEEKHDYEWWVNQNPQKCQLPYVKATPREIWEMAVYATTDYRQEVRWELMDEYGYDPNIT